VHISQVKPEFRSIGVTAHRINEKLLIVGVVYRGKDIIDGVVSQVTSVGLGDGIADMLCESKHHGQVRIIILDEAMLPEPVSVENLWEETEKPVLLFSKSMEVDPKYLFEYKERVVRAAGIDEDSARRVLDRIYCESGIEAIRMSDIILRNIVRLHNV